MAIGTYVLHSCPLLAVSATGFTTSPMDDVLPARPVKAASLADLRAAFDAYRKDLDATGKSYHASVMKHPRCGARKIAGFDKARARGGLLASVMGNQHACPGS